MSFKGVKVFIMPGCEDLGMVICEELKKRLPPDLNPYKEGFRPAEAKFVHFSNGNPQVQVEDVRGHFIVIIHTQVPPVNVNAIRLFALLDAIKNSRCADILLVFPYMPYARSDRKNKPRISVMGKLLPKILIKTFDLQRIIILDPHVTYIKEYYDPTADEVSAVYLFSHQINQIIANDQANKEKYMLAFPDAGASTRFEKVPIITGLPFDYLDKLRKDDTETPEIKKEIFCAGKICIMLDDEISTGGTAILDAKTLKNNKAEKVIMFATHPALNPKNEGVSLKDYREEENPDEVNKLVETLEASPIDHFFFTDSIPCSHKLAGRKKFTIIPVGGLLAEAIYRTIKDESLTELHDIKMVPSYLLPY